MLKTAFCVCHLTRIEMILLHLPTEILEEIASHTIPEGLESFVLTCHRLYELCTPYVQDYTTLRSQFRNFDYYEDTSDPINTIRTAFDVITRISLEPMVARYIRHADFAKDSYFTQGRPREADGAVLRLFSSSPYLREAGLDWQSFYNTIEEDLQAVRYSQHAASFLMTLLPNLETLRLPKRWKPDGTSDKLIETIVHRAGMSGKSLNVPSLAQVSELKSSTALVALDSFDLDWISPFLTLPRLRSFRGPSCVSVTSDGHCKLMPSIPESGFSKNLVVVDLMACCIDHFGIANFLEYTPHLRMLRYSHMAKVHTSPLEWDICRFINAIKGKVGRSLEELSVSLWSPYGIIGSSQASMNGFEQLRLLELPLEMVEYHMAALTASQISPMGNGIDEPVEGRSLDSEPSYLDLVPDTVRELSLIARGTAGDAKVLKTMFEHLPEASTALSLREIQLSCPEKAHEAYKEQCTKLLEQTRRIGVALHLLPFPSSSNLKWSEWWGVARLRWNIKRCHLSGGLFSENENPFAK